MIPYVIVNGATAANLTSPAVDLGDLQVYGIEVLVTGSDVVGTFTLEASNTKNAWVTISGSSQAITASADVFYDVTKAGYRYVRLVFAYTSGTGAITASVVVKENLIKGA
jgi:hypothetical protein